MGWEHSPTRRSPRGGTGNVVQEVSRSERPAASESPKYSAACRAENLGGPEKRRTEARHLTKPPWIPFSMPPILLAVSASAPFSIRVLLTRKAGQLATCSPTCDFRKLGRAVGLRGGCFYSYGGGGRGVSIPNGGDDSRRQAIRRGGRNKTPPGKIL